jgi:hypothetical protein
MMYQVSYTSTRQSAAVSEAYELVEKVGSSTALAVVISIKKWSGRYEPATAQRG